MNRIDLISNVTIESLALRLKRAQGFDVWTAPGFDAWRGELLNPASPLRGSAASGCLVLHGPALFPEGIDFRYEDILSEALAPLLQCKKEHPSKTWIVSTLDLPKDPALPFSAPDLARRAALSWRNALEKAGVLILDLAELAADLGRERFYSAKAWYYGALPFSSQGETLLAEEIIRVEKSVRAGRKKCLVLDLDNTLWGGVVGEEGVGGIVLSDHGPGGVYKDVQKLVKSLANQGVLLAVSSKNNEADARSPFERHPHTELRLEDFVRFKANWDPKPLNLEAIARELNIGVDSLVFVDDNPVEREAVKRALPEATVPDFPKETSDLPAFMRRVARDFFTAPSLDSEDAHRTAMYRAEERRAAERETTLSLDDYLRSLAMRLDLHSLRADEIARASQLTMKTNQFNLTTRRYSEANLSSMLKSEHCRIWVASLSDRYGDYGRIAVLIAYVEGVDENKTAHVDTFLMSCRVMGRGVETALLAGVERALANEGVTLIRAKYLPTPKNTPVANFWSSMGYVSEGGEWLLRAPFPERKTFVCRDC